MQDLCMQLGYAAKIPAPRLALHRQGYSRGAL